MFSGQLAKVKAGNESADRILDFLDRELEKIKKYQKGKLPIKEEQE